MKCRFHSLLFVLAVATIVMCRAVQVDAQRPEEPLFPVWDEDKTTYIDRKGNVVLTVPYSGARFSEGLGRVRVTGMTNEPTRSM